jgi:DnaJ-class molecular chaperone
LSAPTYYDLLEVDEEFCNERVVKTNYRKLCLKHHPDKGGEPSSFLLIKEAFDVLSNDEKREKYHKDIDAAKSAKVESDAVIAQAALQAKKAEKKATKGGRAGKKKAKAKKPTHAASRQATSTNASKRTAMPMQGKSKASEEESKLSASHMSSSIPQTTRMAQLVQRKICQPKKSSLNVSRQIFNLSVYLILSLRAEFGVKCNWYKGFPVTGLVLLVSKYFKMASCS